MRYDLDPSYPGTAMNHAAHVLSMLVATLAAPAPAADPIEVLIVDGHNNHDWRSTTPVIHATLDAAGRFETDVSTVGDPARYELPLAGYDVVVSNYNGPLWPEGTREALEEFVRSGGGLVVVHAADNAFPQWKEYNRMIGVGGWGGRTEKDGPYVRFRDGAIVRDASPGRGGGHGRRHEFVVVTRAPEHPIVSGLPSEWMHAKDELYDRLRGPAEAMTVLATAYSAEETNGTGEHEPILMTIDYGEGRVFHTTLGHDTTSMSGLGFQVTLQRGTEWAATGAVTLPGADESAMPRDRAATRTLAELASLAGWRPLFDGTLDGWTRRSGTAEYHIEEGAIVGRTTEGSPNTFLCTDRLYGDFELRFDVLVDDALNSGVQLRSAEINDKGRVGGPQVEIATNGNAGFVYGEALSTGWLSQDREGERRRGAFQKGQWNRYRVKAEGRRIRTWINGIAVADLNDDRTGMSEGFIGLQVHGIPKGTGPYEVRWRNLYLREL